MFDLASVHRWARLRKRAARARRWNADDEARRRFYAQFVRRGDLVFDVGASIGNRTKVFLGLGAEVVALEPQPDCAEVLRAAFGGKSLHCLECAAGAEMGTAEMSVANINTVSSLSPDWIRSVRESGRFPQGGGVDWSSTIAVPVITLDSLIAEYGVPSFIKIDVEGYELPVLEGLTRKVEALSFEFTPECREAGRSCIGRLRDIGMTQFAYSAAEGLRLDRGWSSPDVFLSALPGIAGYGDIYAR